MSIPNQSSFNSFRPNSSNGMPPLNQSPDYPSFTANMSIPNPFGSSQSLASGMPSGPFPYVPPPTAGPASPRPGTGEVVVQVVRLLDMPVQEKMFSNDLKQYRVRIYDERRQEIGRTQELAGMLENAWVDDDVDTETIRLGPEGIIRVQTQTPVLHLQVEYAGGFLGNMVIGRCRIARADNRSKEIWPYALSNKNNELVGCGIELKVLDDGPMSFMGPPPSASFNAPNTMGPSFSTMPPMMPGTPPPSGPMGGMMPPTGMSPGSGPMMPSYQTIPPMDFMAKGQGKGMPPASWNSRPGSPAGTPPPPFGPPQSFNTMPPQMMPPQMMPPQSSMGMPQMFPTIPGSGMMPPSGGMMKNQRIKQALQGATATYEGKDVTVTLNQLIHANGLQDPTGGSSFQAVFGSDEEIQIWGYGIMQGGGSAGGNFKNDMPLTFEKSTPPPYNLVPLFQHGQVPPGTQQSMQPGTQQSMQPPGTFQAQAQAFQANANVVAVVELDKITDIPAPSDGGDGEVTITLERVQGGKQLASAGPFKTEVQGTLRMVENCKGKLVARVNLEDLAQGAVNYRVAAHYKGPFYKFGSLQRIGATPPFSVSWKPMTGQYVVLLTEPTGKGAALPVGGVYISHRFTQDSEELYKEMTKAGPTIPKEAASEVKQDAAITGYSGKFKAGSQDEVFETAALAVEGQNRAIKQRQKIAKGAKDHHLDRVAESDNPDALIWRNAHGYRDWKNLDSLFVTLGPNYVGQSQETGTNMCRVYEENTTILKEIMAKEDPFGTGKPMDLQDEVLMKELIKDMFLADPEKVLSVIRPVLCKDVSTISHADLTEAAEKPILKIKVHNAMNLRTKSQFLNGPVEPKVIIEIPGKPSSKWESTVARDDTHVAWNQEAIIKDYEYGDDLRIMVVDKEWIGFESHLGEARLPGPDFYPNSFFAQVPLLGANRNKGNSEPAIGKTSSQILIEVKVLEPAGKTDAWPPPAYYCPVWHVNESDQETQRLANWDVIQNAKLAFYDVNPNYQKNEDIWGGCETAKFLDQGIQLCTGERLGVAFKPKKPPRVKDECLMS